MTTALPKARIPRGAWLLLALAGVLFLGCTYPSALEMDYGRSVYNNANQQMLHPLAGLDPTPTVGMGPTAAQNIQEKYDKGYKVPERLKESAFSVTVSQ